MIRQMKKLLTVLILIILIGINFFSIISFANTDYEKYLALGDSIAYGYGLEDRDTQSYAAKVKDNYEIENDNFQNLAISGMTCEEFYSKIQEENYTQAISQADLISISIGSNELLHIGIDAVASVTGVSASDSQFESKAKQAFADANVLQKATMLKGIYDYFTSDDTKQDIEVAISKYEEYWVKSVQYINEKNDDVTIVATQFYNPYYI